MTQPSNNHRTGLLITLLVILILVVGWHLLLPALGVALVLTTGAWGFVVSAILAICVAILLFYVLAGLGIVIVGGLTALWVVLTICLFPILFPILVPLLVILFFIGIIRRRDTKDKKD